MFQRWQFFLKLITVELRPEQVQQQACLELPCAIAVKIIIEYIYL